MHHCPRESTVCDVHLRGWVNGIYLVLFYTPLNVITLSAIKILCPSPEGSHCVVYDHLT